jgi:hypothetical protein
MGRSVRRFVGNSPLKERLLRCARNDKGSACHCEECNDEAIPARKDRDCVAALATTRVVTSALFPLTSRRCIITATSNPDVNPGPGGGRVLVGSAVFKTVSRALVPSWVGSIPMRLRQRLMHAGGNFFVQNVSSRPPSKTS